ncbi:hypothetical protein OJAV_G00058700 [Oryzias javanicus]|uniref:Uncharacterized protein n=1 Tax=Oryzias javanicus TaxID=123683 RepID=A0A437DB60_ORYJA|nr:hypothetical protein OJAV_G00058700 [Oryzias javanicus]
MKPLPDMIPSPVAPPKKLRHSNEVMLHILQSAEHPNIFLQSRPFFSLVVIVCDTNCPRFCFLSLRRRRLLPAGMVNHGEPGVLAIAIGML